MIIGNVAVLYSKKSEAVHLENIDPIITQMLPRIALLWGAFFLEDVDGLTITSGHEGYKTDGVHKPTSLHYSENSPTGMGRALDLRTKDVGAEVVFSQFVFALKALLGKDWDVVKESNHLHIEYQPKTSPIA